MNKKTIEIAELQKWINEIEEPFPDTYDPFDEGRYRGICFVIECLEDFIEAKIQEGKKECTETNK